MTDTASHDTSSQKSALPQKIRLWFENASPFQKSFAEGLGAIIIVLVLLALWMTVRAERTAEKIQAQFPVEAVEILKSGKEYQGLPDDNAAALLEQHDTPDAHEEDKPRPPETAVPSDALTQAPIEGYFERKGELLLPIPYKGAEGTVTPFEAYRRPFEPLYGRPLIAVVIADFGISEKAASEAIGLFPPAVTFALSPYARNTAKWSSALRADGHEFWLTLPMQTASSAIDAGPNAISINTSLQDNQDRLLRVMGAAAGYAGVVSQYDHAFSGDDIDIEPVLEQIYSRGLGYAESNPAISGFAETAAKSSHAPYVRNTLWVGDNPQEQDIESALQNAERSAAKNGHAVVFVRPYPAVLQKVSTWISTFEDRGLQVTPLSYLAKPQAH